MELNVGIQTLTCPTTFLSSTYPIDLGSKPPLGPLGNGISLSPQLNDLSKTLAAQCLFSPEQNINKG